MQAAPYLVLCHASDLAALWAWRELRAADLDVELVTAELLSSALRWVHRVADGSASVEIELADGRHLDSRDVRGTLNRLEIVPLAAAQVAHADGAYAAQEWMAFMVSWLNCLPGVMLNRPHPSGLAGQRRSTADWTLAAVRTGVPVFPYEDSRSHGRTLDHLSRGRHRRVIVVGDQVLGASIPPPVALVEPCRCFARQCGCGLLGMDFIEAADGAWLLGDATPTPDLRTAGPEVIAAVAQTLKG